MLRNPLLRSLLTAQRSAARSFSNAADQQPLRVGIIGAGRIGKVHAQGIQQTSARIGCVSELLDRVNWRYRFGS